MFAEGRADGLRFCHRFTNLIFIASYSWRFLVREQLGHHVVVVVVVVEKADDESKYELEALR